MADLSQMFAKPGVVPLVELVSAEAAVPTAQALLQGGLPCVEVALRTPAALESIRLIRNGVPGLYLGAGTVLEVSQVDQVVDLGVDFVVTPGFNPAVVDRCRELSVPVLPGVATPTEIDMAHLRGIDVLKFFPAQALGGVRYLKAIAGPYRTVRFVPTGGINPENLAEYLALPNVLACAGSWIAPPDLVKAGDFEGVQRLAAAAAAIAGGGSA